MKILFRAKGRCASAAVEPSGQMVTAGSRGIMTEFELSEDYAGLVVYALFKSQNAVEEVLLDAENNPVEVPWEVLDRPSLTFQVGVVGKNSEGSVVIPTIWANVGRIVTAAAASYMGPDDPSADVGTQIVEQARGAAREAAGFAELAESWAVGGTGVRESEDENNAKYYAEEAAMYAEQAEASVGDASWILFDIEEEGEKEGWLYSIESEHFEGADFSVNDENGPHQGWLEVSYT